MSTVPTPVWYLSTEKVSSGFSIAKIGLTKSELKPDLRFCLSSWITQEFDNSLPAAEIVRITFLLKNYLN